MATPPGTKAGEPRLDAADALLAGGRCARTAAPARFAPMNANRGQTRVWEASGGHLDHTAPPRPYWDHWAAAGPEKTEEKAPRSPRACPRSHRCSAVLCSPGEPPSAGHLDRRRCGGKTVPGDTVSGVSAQPASSGGEGDVGGTGDGSTTPRQSSLVPRLHLSAPAGNQSGFLGVPGGGR